MLQLMNLSIDLHAREEQCECPRRNSLPMAMYNHQVLIRSICLTPVTSHAEGYQEKYEFKAYIFVDVRILPA